MSYVGVLLLEGSKTNITPGGCIVVLGRLLWLFELYQLWSRVHLIDVAGHNRLSGCRKPSCSPRQFQGQVVWGLLCLTVLRQVLMEEKHLTKKYQRLQDDLSLIYKFVWNAWIISQIRHITWWYYLIILSRGNVTSWTRSLGRLRDQIFMHIAVQIWYQDVYVSFWNHIAGIACWHVWFHLQCYLLFNFNHSSWGKYKFSGYGVHESNAFDVHEFTA